MKAKDFSKTKNQIIERIKTNSKDAHYAQTLVDELLSIKGQMDVEPMLYSVPVKDVIKEYDYGNFSIVLCKSCIVWHHKGGFDFRVEPRMKALYEYVSDICKMKDNYDELSDDEKTAYNGMLFGMSLVAQLPMFVCVDEELFFDVVNVVMDGLKRMDSYVNNADVQDETPEENAEFEIKMQAAEEVLKDGKD